MEDIRRKRIMAGGRYLTNLLLDPTDKDLNLIIANLIGDFSESDRELLVNLMVMTFQADIADQVVVKAFEGAGYPTPTLCGDPLPEARMWAEDANAKELSSYAMATFERMSTEKRRKFLSWAGGLKGGGR